MYSSRYFLNLIEPIDIQKRAFYPKKYNLLPINKFKNIFIKYFKLNNDTLFSLFLLKVGILAGFRYRSNN